MKRLWRWAWHAVKFFALALWPDLSTHYVPCGYPGCRGIGPRSYYCVKHRAPLASRLRGWWEHWV